MRSRIAVLMLSAACLVANASEPDWEREVRLADEVVDVILDGDPEWLSADGREFLSIYIEAESPRAGVAGSKQILLPDANHYFTDRGDALVEAVAPWLSSLQ